MKKMYNADAVDNGSKKSISLTAKITIFVLIALFACSSAIGVLAYMLNREVVINESAKLALDISKTVSAALDSELYAEIMETGDVDGYYGYIKAFLDEALEKNNLAYLYIIDNEYDSHVTYFAEGYPSEGKPDEVEYVLGDTEAADVYPVEMFDTLKTGEEHSTGVYNLGGYGEMVSGFSAITDKSGNVLAVVGVDLAIHDAMAATLSDKTARNAQMAEQSATLSDAVKLDAEKGNVQMEQLLAAVRVIHSLCTALTVPAILG